MVRRKTAQQVLSKADLRLLSRHYKFCLENKDNTEQRRSPFSKAELCEISSLYEVMREKHGYYPDSLDSAGNIVWGTRPVSKLEAFAMENDKYYSEIGKKVMSKKGALAAAMLARKDEMAD